MSNLHIYAGWKEYRQGKISDRELERIIRENARLRKVAVDLNSVCNLRCQHCSYDLPETKLKEDLTAQDFCKVADQAIDLGVKVIASGGKEPLLVPEKALRLFSHIRERSKDLATGIVTNATLVDERRLGLLQKMGLSYINVSIDGTEEYHDQNRGQGTFKKTFEGLRTIQSSHIAEEVLVSSTLMSYNEDNIRKLMKFCSDNAGVNDFYVGVYIATGRNRDEWKITSDTVVKFLDSIQDHEGEVILDVHSDTQQIWDDLERSGHINVNNTFEARDGIIAAKVGRHHVINSMFTSNYWNTLLISSTGHAFGDYCLREDRNYLKDGRVVGNVKETKLKELFARSIQVGFPYFLSKICKYS